MSCPETQTWLDAYADGELDLAGSVQLEGHLETCADCTRAHRDKQVLRVALRDNADALRYRPSPELLQRLGSLVRREGRVEPSQIGRQWLPLAAALALLIMLAVGLLRLSSSPPATELVARDVLSSHVRSLMPNHLTDVTSSDHHTVKPWFDGKLSYSPEVLDLKQQGFPLAGGRLDYVAGRPVATLIYRRRRHVINVFTWPADPGRPAPPHLEIRQGYQLYSWTAAGMDFWAVSDLNASELQQFVQLLQSHGA